MDAIVLGGNEQGGKLSADNYMMAIYLRSIVWVQFSEWHLFGGIYHYSIILLGNSFSATCPRANYLRAITGEAIFGMGNYLGGNYPWENCLGTIIRLAIIWGAIVQGTIILGVNCPGVNYPGGNCKKYIYILSHSKERVLYIYIVLYIII